MKIFTFTIARNSRVYVQLQWSENSILLTQWKCTKQKDKITVKCHQDSHLHTQSECISVIIHISSFREKELQSQLFIEQNSL